MSEDSLTEVKLEEKVVAAISTDQYDKWFDENATLAELRSIAMELISCCLKFDLRLVSLSNSTDVNVDENGETVGLCDEPELMIRWDVPNGGWATVLIGPKEMQLIKKDDLTTYLFPHPHVDTAQSVASIISDFLKPENPPK